MTKTAKLVWLNDARGSILRAKIEAPALTPSELADLEALAREHGFGRLGANWEAPDIDPLGATRRFVNAAFKQGIVVIEEHEP